MRYYFVNSRFWLTTAVLVIFYYGILTYAKLPHDKTGKTIVKMDIYYSPASPGSAYFIIKQLKPSYRVLKNHLNITFIPYGLFMYPHRFSIEQPQSLSDIETGDYIEYVGHVCGINGIKSSEKPKKHQRLILKLISCTMSSRNNIKTSGLQRYDGKFLQCCLKIGLTKETVRIIERCRGNSFTNHMAYRNMTAAIIPSLRRLPTTIVINGVYTQENQDEAMNYFTNLICRHLTEPEKPSVCTQ